MGKCITVEESGRWRWRRPSSVSLQPCDHEVLSTVGETVVVVVVTGSNPAIYYIALAATDNWAATEREGAQIIIGVHYHTAPIM